MKRKKLRCLLTDFWKRSQGNQNVNVVTQMTQHPEPKREAPRPGASRGSPSRKRREVAGHVASMRLVEVTNFQVQKSSLNDVFSKEGADWTHICKWLFACAWRRGLSLPFLSRPLSWLHSESARLCFVQLRPFGLRFVLGCHRMAFPPGKGLVGFIHASYLWVVLLCFPKVSSEVNSNNCVCSEAFPSEHSHGYLWETNFQRCSVPPRHVKAVRAASTPFQLFGTQKSLAVAAKGLLLPLSCRSWSKHTTLCW